MGNQDLDAALMRSLSQLTAGNPLEFCDHRMPPTAVKSWLRQADPREVRGMLLATLSRWHELRQEEGDQ